MLLTFQICPAGLQAAIDLIEPIKAKYPAVSYADLYQMASAVAVEVRHGL
jgi:L-ascorbate peroxidase